ncbi:MAG: YceI family protein [Candidatus Dadabacteria bacterium]
MRSFIKTPYLIIALLVSSIGYIVSCTHENDALVNTTPKATRGTEVLLPGNMTAGNPNEWKLDKVHSNVQWSTQYMNAAGLLTGRFNQFGMANVSNDLAINYNTTGQPLKDNSWAFYESDPTKTFLDGYVQLNTFNTGEPGRDAGCALTSLGTTAIVAGVQNLTPANLAKIHSTKVELDPTSNDYIVTLDLTWKGGLAAPATKQIVGKLHFSPVGTVTSGTNSYKVFGLQLQFSFNCRDFGVTSTSIADKIDLVCNMNFNNK